MVKINEFPHTVTFYNAKSAHPFVQFWNQQSVIQHYNYLFLFEDCTLICPSCFHDKIQLTPFGTHMY